MIFLFGSDSEIGLFQATSIIVRHLDQSRCRRWIDFPREPGDIEMFLSNKAAPPQAHSE
jgi:hypothetical protein